MCISCIIRGEYAGVIEYYGLEKHYCKQSIRTKCSPFDQWTQLISELACSTGIFNEGVANRQKKNPRSSLLLVLQDERTDGPHPETQALLFRLLFSRRVLKCNNSDRSLKFLHPNNFVLLCFFFFFYRETYMHY